VKYALVAITWISRGKKALRQAQDRLPATKTAGEKTEGNDLLRDKCQNTEAVNDLSNNKTFVNEKNRLKVEDRRLKGRRDRCSKSVYQENPDF
jgi:hypothetical protein